MSYSTEERNVNTTHIDEASTLEMLSMLQNENMVAVRAVGDALESIALAVDSVSEGVKKGGRLIYIGAGTSGRLGVLDAAECPPTFGVSEGLVIGIIAGGEKCLKRASEGEEDNGLSGVKALKKINLSPLDHVVGISASGGASFVLEALRYAKNIGAVTIGLTSNFESKLATESDFSIVTKTGAEAITGSTRLKAGTAQKLVLNMLSTCAMIKTGKVYENLMINLKPTNIKLKKRVISIVCEVCKIEENQAIDLLDKNGYSIKTAIENYQKLNG